MEQPICRENKPTFPPQTEHFRGRGGFGPWAMQRQLLAGEQRRGYELKNSTHPEPLMRLAGTAGAPARKRAIRRAVPGRQSFRAWRSLRAGRPRSQHITWPLGICAVYADEEILSSCRTERIAQVLVYTRKVSPYTCKTATYTHQMSAYTCKTATYTHRHLLAVAKQHRHPLRADRYFTTAHWQKVAGGGVQWIRTPPPLLPNKNL